MNFENNGREATTCRNKDLCTRRINQRNHYGGPCASRSARSGGRRAWFVFRPYWLGISLGWTGGGTCARFTRSPTRRVSKLVIAFLLRSLGPVARIMASLSSLLRDALGGVS